MTHGEAWYQEKKKLQNLDGLDTNKAISMMKLPDKMTNAQISKHYNKKLFDYWVTCIESKIALKRKKEIVSALMFGHTKTYEKYEEEQE